MSSLEERCIAAKRKAFLDANALTLAKEWDRVGQVRGGNEHVVFAQSLRRDIVAYTIVHALDALGGTVFGGFVRSHFSGKPWNDLDVFVSQTLPTRFIIKWITFTLPFLRSIDVRIDVVKQKATNDPAYARRHVLRIPKHSIAIQIDSVQMSKFSRSVFLPATLGSCLQMSGRSVSYRITVENAHIDIEELLDLLSNGEDVKLCGGRGGEVSPDDKNYWSYYWSRIRDMQRVGWSLDAYPSIGQEPSKSSPQQASS